jgi:hypothetical protein
MVFFVMGVTSFRRIRRPGLKPGGGVRPVQHIIPAAPFASGRRNPAFLKTNFALVGIAAIKDDRVLSASLG